jgi:hypothetical protein
VLPAPHELAEGAVDDHPAVRPVHHEERIRHRVQRVAQEVARALHLLLRADALQLRARARREGPEQRMLQRVRLQRLIMQDGQDPQGVAIPVLQRGPQVSAHAQLREHLVLGEALGHAVPDVADGLADGHAAGRATQGVDNPALQAPVEPEGQGADRLALWQ